MATIGKGVFTRSRFDFLIQNGTIGATHNPNAAKGIQSRIALQNNDTLGRSIACYALLVYCQSNPPTVLAAVETARGTPAIPSGTNGGMSPFFPTQQLQPGFIRSDGAAGISDEWNYVFSATGDKWIHLDGSPLAIIPPGWMFALWPTQAGADLYCTFLWAMLEDKAAGSI